MSTIVSLTVFLMLLSVQNLFSAVKDFPIRFDQIILENGCRRAEPQTVNTAFRVDIVSDDSGIKTEHSRKDGYTFVEARRGEQYSVNIYNPLPVRVAVNLTVDGLNSITGKPSGIANGAKWMIDPYSSITIHGWQINSGDARRFFFTNKSKSYARWRERVIGHNLSANCGVIGASFFWNSDELQRYYDEHPIIKYNKYSPCPEKFLKSKCESSWGADRFEERENEYKKDVQKAGTGMGERISNPTTMVEFHYNAGMYKMDEAVLIFYDFAKYKPCPNPFPDITYAPEISD